MRETKIETKVGIPEPIARRLAVYQALKDGGLTLEEIAYLAPKSYELDPDFHKKVRGES